MNAPPYRYECVDRSPLVTPFCRWVVRWFVLALPRRLPPNLVTLGSSACVWAILGEVWWAQRQGQAVAAAACAVLMAAYVIYDHADGMQARRTGASGPLGEFLDHYLDALHGPIAVGALFAVAGRAASPWLAPAVAAMALTGAAIMVEQRERGMLYFGFPGPLEGMLITVVCFGLAARPATAAWVDWPVAGGLRAFEAAAALLIGGSLMTTVGCVRRMGRLPAGLATMAGATGALLVGTWHGPPAWAAAVVGLHAADYTGRVIASHLQAGPRGGPDLLAPVVVLAAGLTHHLGAEVAGGVAAYLAVRNAWTAWRVVRHFRAAWRWWLPPAAAGR